MTEDPTGERVEFEVRGVVGRADLFQPQPSTSRERPPAAWETAREVIDHGCFILITMNQLRPDHRVRDCVTSALLRRALITAEGIYQLVSNGLEEPAAQLLRTLLEISVNLQLIVQDPSDRMAKRLAAFHYAAGQRYGTSLLAERETRLKLEAHPGETEWVKANSQSLKEYFESPEFFEVRDDVRRAQHWHGYPNTEEAYRAAGAIDDYRSIYILYSPFVHANNIDFDLAGFDGDNPALKPPRQPSFQRTLNMLGGAVLMLLEICERFVEDRDSSSYSESAEVRVDGGNYEKVSPLAILQLQATTIFNQFFGTDDSVQEDSSPGD